MTPAALIDAVSPLVAAATRDLGGLTLFAGQAAQPLPDDPRARAMRLTASLRELRGSAHLTAVVASGLATPVAHAIRHPERVATFGWRDGDIPEPTVEDRRRLQEAERVTNMVLARVYEALDESAGDALLAGARAIVDATGTEAARL